MKNWREPKTTGEAKKHGEFTELVLFGTEVHVAAHMSKTIGLRRCYCAHVVAIEVGSRLVLSNIRTLCRE